MKTIYRTLPYGEGRWKGLGWRSRSLVGALGLRPPLSDARKEEMGLLREHLGEPRRMVELGVFEGAASAALGGRLGPDSELVLVDPYPPGKLLGLNMARVIARRAVRRAVEARVRWLRETSNQAVARWEEPIDFLRIDGLHTLEGVQRDWIDWTPFVVPGGRVALRCDVVTETAAEHVQGDEIVPWILAREDDWELTARLDTTAILTRRA